MVTRIGGVLVLTALAFAFVMAGSAASGWAIGADSATGRATMLGLAILAAGALSIAAGDRPPFDGRLVRRSLVLLAIASGALVASSVRSLSIATDSFSETLTLSLLILGMVMTPVALAGLGVGMLRRGGIAAWIGATLLAGLVLVGGWVMLRQDFVGATGAILVSAALAAVSVLAIVPRAAGFPGPR